MSDTIIKKSRGRPRKVQRDISPSSSPEIQSELQIQKKPRGRPAKYLPEERETKYKEARKIIYKEYYKEHQEEQSKYIKEYQDRSRHALKVLRILWVENLIEIKSEKYREIIQHLVEDKFNY